VSIEPTAFKALMAGVPAPVTVVTTAEKGKPFGATVSSFASLSLAPPLISIALIEGSSLLGTVRKSRRFAVNLLGHRQADIALRFASRNEDRFESVSWVWDENLPRILNAASFVVCELEQEVMAGDHALLFGRVTDGRVTTEPPLVYTARAFGTNSKLISERELTIGDAIAACAS
jgi:flavin reductase (DIM6/NTAB) family NADH-FMN oxidoreductase RutF